MAGVITLLVGAIAAAFSLHSGSYYLLPINIACMLIGVVMLARES